MGPNVRRSRLSDEMAMTKARERRRAKERGGGSECGALRLRPASDHIPRRTNSRDIGSVIKLLALARRTRRRSASPLPPRSGRWDRLHRCFPSVTPSWSTPLHQPLFSLALLLKAAVACAFLRFVAQGRSRIVELSPRHWQLCLAGRPRLRNGFGGGVPDQYRSYR